MKSGRPGLALFAGGFVTFSLLYCVQPLMPAFSQAFGVSPAAASLTLSVATAPLAVCMLLAAPLSEAHGRTVVLKSAVLASSLLGLLAPLSPTFASLLLVRVLQGVTLAGVPAVAMAYLGEEVPPGRAGAAMGLFISGNAIGGMSGRILTGLVTDRFGWRAALLFLAVVTLLVSLWFAAHLPPSRNFRPRPVDAKSLARSLRTSLSDPALLCLYAIAFLVMGSFVTIYNYVAYLLMGPPWNLSHAAVSWIFLVYLVGTVSSPVMGRLADRHGRRKVLWLATLIQLGGACTTLAPGLGVKVAGVAVFTYGFFGAHAVASSWVTLRAASENAAASALYLLFYYLGSSVGGWLGGIFWSRLGWGGVIGMISAFLSLAIGLSFRLQAIPALAKPAPAAVS